jgi:hypothetical protein
MKKLNLNSLTDTINYTFERTVKFNPDGSLGHTLDRDVFRVIAIAIASDILDRHNTGLSQN